MTKTEILGAVLSHSSPQLQKLWSTAQQKALQEAVTVLSDMKALERNEGGRSSNPESRQNTTEETRQLDDRYIHQDWSRKECHTRHRIYARRDQSNRWHVRLPTFREERPECYRNKQIRRPNIEHRRVEPLRRPLNPNATDFRNEFS